MEGLDSFFCACLLKLEEKAFTTVGHKPLKIKGSKDKH